MPKVYCASPGLNRDDWEPFAWHPSNNSICVDNGPDNLPSLRSDFEDIIKAIPQGVKTGFNFEYVSNSSYQYLDAVRYPKESAEIFKMLDEAIYDIAPDLDYCYYTMPQPTWKTTKEEHPNYSAALCEAMEEMKKECPNLKTAAFSGYWKDYKHDDTWDRWTRRMDMSIALSRTIWDLPPVAFVWNQAGGWSRGMPIHKFYKILAYFGKRDIDVIYWSSWANPSVVSWETQFALWEFTQGKFRD